VLDAYYFDLASVGSGAELANPDVLAPTVLLSTLPLPPTASTSASEVNVQLPDVVGVSTPSSWSAGSCSALWKSPKSPNESNEESSSENEELKVKLSTTPTAAESENGPKPS